jgi:hypothetical protein
VQFLGVCLAGRLLEKMAGEYSGKKVSGRSNSTSKRSSRGNMSIGTSGNTWPPFDYKGWGSDGYGKIRWRLISSATASNGGTDQASRAPEIGSPRKIPMIARLASVIEGADSEWRAMPASGN